MAGSGDRTEKPTGKRLHDARKKGQVVRSRDLAQTAGLAGVLLVFSWVGSGLMGGMADSCRFYLSGLDRFPGRDLTIAEVSSIALLSMKSFVVITAPVALAAAVAIIGVSVAQGGWVVASEAMKLDFGRLSPANGLSRLKPSMAGMDLVKVSLAATVLGVVGYRIAVAHIADVERLARLSPLDSSVAAWHDIERLLRQAVIALLALAGGDYLLQRYRLMSSLKMTKQEVKDEFRNQEGNPQIKSKIRGMQMQMARRRMLAAVPKATVVVTNPTHFAVALEYRRAGMFAPRVVAKGRGFVAQRIKAIAREHGVPTVENVPLAQALYKTVEIGESIPAALFEAVAEVLAYLIRLKQLAV